MERRIKMKSQLELINESNLIIKDLLNYIAAHITDYYITYNGLLLDQFILNEEKQLIYYSCKLPFLGGGQMKFDSFDVNKLSIKFPVNYFEYVLENIKELKQ